MGSIPATLVLINKPQQDFNSHIKLYIPLKTSKVQKKRKEFNQTLLQNKRYGKNFNLKNWRSSKLLRLTQKTLIKSLNKSVAGRFLESTKSGYNKLESSSSLARFWDRWYKHSVSVTTPSGGKYSTRRLRWYNLTHRRSKININRTLKAYKFSKKPLYRKYFQPQTHLNQDLVFLYTPLNSKLKTLINPHLNLFIFIRLLFSNNKPLYYDRINLDGSLFLNYYNLFTNRALGINRSINLNSSLSKRSYNLDLIFTNNRKHLIEPTVSAPKDVLKKSNFLKLKTLSRRHVNKSSMNPNLLQVYLRYYAFIESRWRYIKRSHTRPIYSTLLTTNFVKNRALIILQAGELSTSFKKSIWNVKTWNFYKGYNLLNQLKSRDNLLNVNHQALTLLNNSEKDNSVMPDYYRAHLSSKLKPLVKYNLFQNNFMLNSQYAPLFKFVFWNHKVMISSNTTPSSFLRGFNFTFDFENKKSFNSRLTFFRSSNLTPLSIFKYSIRRKVIKLVVSSKYLPKTTPYFYKTLVSFIEFYTSRKVYLKFNPFIENALPYTDIARSHLWHYRVLGFQKLLGHRIFVHESLKIFHIALRYKDPTFLSNWIKAMLYRMSFWKYRILFRYIKYVLQNLFLIHFPELNFKGLKLTLKGKIGVAGNARTRTLSYAIGSSSNSKMDNRILSHFTTVNSFTGVMGFRLSFYY